MPDWRDAVCTALDFWISQEGSDRRKAGPSLVGPARPSGDGWHTLDVRGTKIDLDQAESLRLAGPEQPKAGEGYRALEAVQDGPLIKVRVAEFVDLPDPHLWQQKQPATHLIIKLREGIARLDAVGLADDLAAGRLAGAPARPREVAGFTLEQRQALAACLGAGVRLVWGPPGTGKTRVLTEAISELVAAGRRILLVSATNIAVDNALLGVVKGRRYDDGVLLRVGPPHHPEMLEHPEICLPPLVRMRLTAAEAELKNLEAQLLLVRRDHDRLERLNEAVDGFDPAAHHAVVDRLARLQRIPELAEADRNATAACTAAAEVTAHRQADRAAAEQRVRALAGARAAYRRIDELHAELVQARSATDRLTGDALQARAEAESRAAAVRRLDAAPLLTRIRNRGTRLREGAAWQAADQAARAAEGRAWHGGQLFNRRLDEAQQEIQRLQTTAAGTRDDVAAADRLLADARRQEQRAQDEQQRAEKLAEKARRELSALQGEPPPTGEELAAVERADRLGLPARAAERDALNAELAARAPQVSLLQQRYSRAQDAFEGLRKDAEGELIAAARVVATTLARMRTNHTVMAGMYDVVLVDEVGAANLPEVLLAVSRAGRAAVLLGDFMQLGAILPKAVTDSSRSDVRQWLATDVFAHCGIRSPADACAHPGCTALDVQHRFGLEVMHLANAIAYDDLLRAGEQIRPRAADDPEIVLLDVDGMGDLGLVRSTGPHKGWWPAGALLSRVLADYHQERGERTGIVTPYGDQVEATLEALRDQESSSGIVTEVGTAHRFQGREFPIVVFDLVEDAHTERWMSAASLSLGAYERDGVRLFNVAVTRTQTRLYLIGSRRRIDEARPGSPLAKLAVLLRERRARTVSGACLVAPTLFDVDDRYGLGPFGTELAEVLARHVQITAIDDEETFYATLSGHLAEAERSVWLWAPWTRARVMSLLPDLAAASARGVSVRVFVRDPDDGIQQAPDSRRYLERLQSAVRSVVAIREMHQKIVVIDDRLVLLGSLNALSQQYSREVMLTVRGGHFARKLLAHEHASAFAGPPPSCEVCHGAEVGLRRIKNKGWQWYCYSRSCPNWHAKGSTNWWQPVRTGGKGRGRKT